MKTSRRAGASSPPRGWRDGVRTRRPGVQRRPWKVYQGGGVRDAGTECNRNSSRNQLRGGQPIPIDRASGPAPFNGRWDLAL